MRTSATRRLGDSPRTMVQKILAGRGVDGGAEADQVALAAAPHAAVDEALARGLKRTGVEAAVAYETTCVGPRGKDAQGRAALLAHGLVVARAGAGFPAPVHLERFASPARLCVTDDPRFASVGGIGMLALHANASELGAALAGLPIEIPAPRSVHVLLSGRTRPFVCARDVALDLIRRGLGDVVQRAAGEHGARVVVEIGGPSVRLLSVGDRAVIASVAPHVGAIAAIFPSDERTEVFLRDQRRSKAHRALAPDPGAPFDDVMQVDLGAVDPLVLEGGKVRAARELAGKAVAQVVLGGDGGVTLRDLLATAMLLKSKRVPPGLDLLFAPPTRQMLEVLAAEGALSDLIATGARLVEPDARVASGELYPSSGLVAQSADLGAPNGVVASPETLAFAVATGALGDPRGFKRPVRVSVPRSLPTDDVLVLRGGPLRSKPQNKL
ncbi:MAG TPA: aconitase family protein [Polyangiaceae bacterium]|jgi:aconitate hydratase